MRHVPILLLALVLPLALVACGDEESGGSGGPVPDETVEAIQVPAWQEENPPPPGEGSQKEYVRLVLPRALNARTFDHRRALVLNVLPDGNVTLKGSTWILAGGTPEEHAASRTALGDQVAALTKSTGPLPLLLHADRLVPWSTISTLLMEASGWEAPPTEIAIAAFRPPDGRRHALGGTWTKAGEETAVDRDAVPVSVAFRPGEEGPSLHMVVGRNNWSLGRVPDSFDDARFLKAMNRTWRKVADYLQTEVRGETNASLRIARGEDGVWLAHVVTMLDLLASTGVEEVLFPVEGLRLRIGG